MKIVLNGKNKEFEQEIPLSALILSFSKENKNIIAEINGDIIQDAEWDKTILKDGDTVELLNFVGGGCNEH